MRKFKHFRDADALFKWHRYLGLVLGILIAIADLTDRMMIAGKST